MATMNTGNARRSVVAALAMVAFTGLMFDQAHLSAAPYGTVEVGELTPVNLERLVQATLPEVVVTGQRVVQFAGVRDTADGNQG